VLKDGKAHKIYEITGKNVPKGTQLSRTAEMIKSGAYIRRPGSRDAQDLIKIKKTIKEEVLTYD
jgi:hypothetical protein